MLIRTVRVLILRIGGPKALVPAPWRPLSPYVGQCGQPQFMTTMAVPKI